MATIQGSSEISTSIQSVEQSNCDFNESQEKKIEEAINRLRQREEPVNILVIGPTGVGKSTLINALLGKTVAEEGAGAASVQSEVKVHEGKHDGIKIRVYDTTGFSDTRGKSGNSIVEEIAQASKFDLILICVRMDSRADEGVRMMFTVLGENLRREMWDRSVIVLTFANAFLGQRSIKKSPNKAEKIRSKIEDFKGHIHRFLSNTLKKETIDEIPFCIAGEEEETKLPTTHNWIQDLWGHCVKRCSEDVRNFLNFIGKYRIKLMEAGTIYGGTAIGLVLGGVIGGAAGSIVPVTGNIVGAAAGAMIGGGIGATVSSTVVAVKRNKEKKKQPSGQEQKD